MSTLRKKSTERESSVNGTLERNKKQTLGADRLVGNWFYFLKHRQAAGANGQLGDSRSQPATQ